MAAVMPAASSLTLAAGAGTADRPVGWDETSTAGASSATGVDDSTESGSAGATT
jgi:hypothetical protein